MELRVGTGRKFFFCDSESLLHVEALVGTRDREGLCDAPSTACRLDLAEPCGVVTTDFEAASGGWPAVQHFAPRGGPGLPVRSRGRHMVGLERGGRPKPAARAARSSRDTTARGVRPHGTALLLARAKTQTCDCSSGLAFFRGMMRSNPAEATSVPWFRSGISFQCRAVHPRWDRCCLGSVATAPEIPQLSHPSMEPELAIVVVETGKAPDARVEARSLRSSGL